MRSAVSVRRPQVRRPSPHGSVPRSSGRQRERGVLALFRSSLSTELFSQLNTSFINGYSGILVGLIMLDVPLNQDLVISALRSHPTAMKNLVEAMEEFATLHETSERAERVDAMEGVEESQESNATEVEESVVTSGIAVSIRGMLEGLRRKGAGI